MAEGTYEYECMRAELLGIEKPNEEEFERTRAEQLKQLEEEQDAAEANLLSQQEENLTNVGGKLDELNSILSSTQQKLNRFKQTACGSLSNIFGRNSVDVPSTGSNSNVIATTSRRNTTAIGGDNGKEDFSNDADINVALNNIDELQKNQHQDIQPVIPTEKIREAKMNMQKTMSSHLSKLDSLISKAENADIAMAEQTQQMRKMAK